MKSRYFVALAAVLGAAPLAANAGSRDTGWDFGGEIIYQNSLDVDFEGGSKAVVAHLVGHDRGLASERAYASRTLPLGVVRGIADTMRHRDRSGLPRAGAIVAGFVATAAGYVGGRLTFERSARRRGWEG